MVTKKPMKETTEQTQAIRDRYAQIGDLIKTEEVELEKFRKSLKTEIGAIKDKVKAMRAEIKPLEAYLKAMGEIPRRKRAKKVAEPVKE